MGMKADLSDIIGELPDENVLIDLMGQDKKVLDGKLTFIMARGIGDTFVSHNVELDIVRDILREALI
jgi:3-dehydroquinate synthase